MATSVHANEHALEAPGFVYAANSRDVAKGINGGVAEALAGAEGSHSVCMLLARREGGSRPLGRSANA